MSLLISAISGTVKALYTYTCLYVDICGIVMIRWFNRLPQIEETYCDNYFYNKYLKIKYLIV